MQGDESVIMNERTKMSQSTNQCHLGNCNMFFFESKMILDSNLQDTT